MPAIAGAASGCPNAEFRTSYSAALPACRAYELVSPPGAQPYFTTFTGANSSNNSVLGSIVLGAAQGVTATKGSVSSRIAFFSSFAPAGSTTDGPYYLSTRGPAGWSTANVVPPQSTELSVACLPHFVGWSNDLESGILADGFEAPTSTCGADEPELVPGEPRGVQNLFRLSSGLGTFQIINKTPPTVTPANSYFQTASRDLGVIVFDEEAQLTPGAPKDDNFYVSSGGALRLLTILPDGTATQGELAAATLQLQNKDIEHEEIRDRRETSPTFTRSLAPDGSRAEFVAGGNLYGRENPGKEQSSFDAEGNCDQPLKACTVQIDASETGETGGGGELGGTSGESGDVVYFSDTKRLTSDSTAAAGAPDLYEYDFRRPRGERLLDLSVDHNAGEHADVLGFVDANETGVAGDFAYFVATGVLAQNTNTSGAAATAGAPNLYAIHGGATRFIATLSPADSCDWNNLCLTSRVSSNGRYLGFDSFGELTGVNNLNAETNEPDQNIFLYDAATEELACASCGSSGPAPLGPASIRLPVERFTFFATPKYLQRNVSDSGQVFFDTKTPLLAAARNGQQNVYEYGEGMLHLLSSGTSEGPSFFYEASADGNDVYLITAQELVKGADSADLAIYDARVGGGFPAAPEQPAPCSGETCSGPQGAAFSPPAIASEAVSGQGNLQPEAPKAVTTKPKPLTNARKLAKALKACRARRARHTRAVCESQARKRYGPKTKTKSAKTDRRGK
jgi:hypothetical protein